MKQSKPTLRLFSANNLRQGEQDTMLTATFDEKMNRTAGATMGPAAALRFTTVGLPGRQQQRRNDASRHFCFSTAIQALEPPATSD